VVSPVCVSSRKTAGAWLPWALVSFILAWAFEASIGIAFLVFPSGLSSRTSGCGADAPQVPTFNTWPLTYASGLDCHDYPLIDVRNLSVKEGRSSHFSLDSLEHDRGIEAKPGDHLSAKIYFNNGAWDSLSERVARHTKIRFSLSPSDEHLHFIAGEIWADNAERARSRDIGKGGDILVTTPRNSWLRFIAGSAGMCIHDAHVRMLGIEIRQRCDPDFAYVPLADSIPTEGVDIGSLPPMYTFSGFAFVELVVEASTP
jgi:hypothetical protein